MIRICETDHDVLHFLWLKQHSTTMSDVVHLHFTRLALGLHPSPAILGTITEHHLSKHRKKTAQFGQENGEFFLHR